MPRAQWNFTCSAVALTTDEMDALIERAVAEGWPATRLAEEVDNSIKRKQAERLRSLN